LKQKAISLLPIVLLAAGLGACSSEPLTESKLNPVRFFQKQDWASAKTGEEDFKTSAPVAPEDFVDANGACAATAAQASVPAAPPPPPAADGSAAPPPADFGAPSVVGGVALGMTECDVVRRAGQPGNIEINGNANEQRTTVLTYMTGTWPGIYHFSSGRLKEIERVAAPPPPPAVKKKVVKRKPKPKPQPPA
jgi:hypothetical protein